MRTVFVTVTVNLQIAVDEGVQISDVMESVDYSFNSKVEGADIQDFEIVNHEITDSK